MFKDGQTDNKPVSYIELPYSGTVELGINITKDNLPYTGYKSIVWGTSLPDGLMITPSDIGASVDTGNGIKSAVCRISIPPGIVDGGHDDFEDDGTEWKPDPKE